MISRTLGLVFALMIAAVLARTALGPQGRMGAVSEAGLKPTKAAIAKDAAQEREIENLRKAGKLQKATFGGGCFWGVEAAFRNIRGVTSTRVGYCGGHVDHPTYEQVCTHTTGHAESVEVEFNPAKVSYTTLLDVFWRLHDPTQVERQGPDIGENYRSVIFYHSPEQKRLAQESKQALDKGGKLGAPIATHISPATTFWPAEDYHQQYLEKRGMATCHAP